MESYFVTVRVDAVESLPASGVTRLVQRLIDAGLEDAGSSPDDWSDPDKENIELVVGITVGAVAQLGGGVK